jgi:NAD(P)-dependent dehydrogenase (short-subunit alcohol dehydrogenase family)
MSEYTTRTLIVGATRGIGRATARELAGRGHRLALGYLKNEALARDLAAELGPDTVLVAGDVAEDGARLVEQADGALGGLDHVVVTAVPLLMGPLSSITREQAQRSMDVNVTGFREVAFAAREALTGSGGSLIALSSLGSYRYASYYGALGPAKAALESTVRYLAAEFGPNLIRVNAVAPSLVNDPEHFADAPEAAKFLDAAARRTPLGRRLATPADVARIIAGLLGDDFAFLTGQVITVDGGYSLLA